MCIATSSFIYNIHIKITNLIVAMESLPEDISQWLHGYTERSKSIYIKILLNGSIIDKEVF